MPEIISQRNKDVSADVRGMTKEAASLSGGTSIRAIMPKYYDPVHSPSMMGIPYNVDDDAERKKALTWCNFFYDTHDIVAGAIDLYARFPMVGMYHSCSDSGVKKEFDELFLDELCYGDFLVDLGIEYWKSGEAIPYGTWDSIAKRWIADTLIAPQSVEVRDFPLLGSTFYELEPPQYLKDLAMGGSSLLGTSYSDQARAYYDQERALLTDSNRYGDLYNQIINNQVIMLPDGDITLIKHKTQYWRPRGTPILLRAFRYLYLEEKFQRALMAISERYTTPFLLATIGNLEKGTTTGVRWRPGRKDISNLRLAMDAALSSEHRVLVHSADVEVKDILAGVYRMDYQKELGYTTKRILGAFGLPESLIAGASGKNTYAEAALAAENAFQRLKTYQSYLTKFLIKYRYEKFAKENKIFVKEKKGDRYIVKKRTRKVTNDDGVVEIIEEDVPYVPGIKFRTMDWRDEKTRIEFFKNLRDVGIPISDERILVSVDIDLSEERDAIVSETVKDVEAKLNTARRIIADLEEKGVNTEHPLVQEILREKGFGSLVKEKDRIDLMRPGAEEMGGEPGEEAGVLPGLEEKPEPDEDFPVEDRAGGGIGVVPEQSHERADEAAELNEGR